MNKTYLPQMEEISKEAGALLMTFFGKISIEYKGEADLVTEADRAAERLITERIVALWPDHDLMGEEGARREHGSDYKWHIDPLDGTTNFAHGFPVFCVSLGLTQKGQRIAGVVFDPTRNELFAAERGSGSFLNGSAIHVSNTKKLVESLVATGFPSHKRHQNPNIHYYHQITLRSHGIRRAGSAALDLCSAAAGRVDGFWEFNLNPWDTAAGVLLVEEAGGIVTDMQGGPFKLASREVLASNRLIHDELLKQFAAIRAGRVEGLPDPKSFPGV